MLAVIVPVYERAYALREALASLKAQTFKRFITIVVDDHSEADYENIKAACDEADQTLNLVYLRNDENRGPGCSREVGLSWAINHNIDLVTFLDSDDLLYPNGLKLLTYEINHSHSDIVATNICVEHNNEPYSAIPAEKSVTWMHGKIYRTKFLSEHGIHFPTNLRTNEDLAFNLKAFWVGGIEGRTASVDHEAYLWRDDKNSLTRADTEMRGNCLGSHYIEAIYDAVSFIVKYEKFDIRRALPNIVMCYNYYQMARARGENLARSDRLIQEMLAQPRVRKAMERPLIWQNLAQNIRNYYASQDELLFFKETYEHWYRGHGGMVAECKQ